MAGFERFDRYETEEGMQDIKPLSMSEEKEFAGYEDEVQGSLEGDEYQAKTSILDIRKQKETDELDAKSKQEQLMLQDTILEDSLASFEQREDFEKLTPEDYAKKHIEDKYNRNIEHQHTSFA